MKMHNLFAQPIVVVHGRIFHQQFDYAHYPEDYRYCEQTMNKTWSPVAEQPDQDVALGFAVDLKCSEGAPSVLYLASFSDNPRFGPNSSGFRAFGLTLDGPPRRRSEREWSYVALDKEKGVCEGGNNRICAAHAVLYDQAPSRIELSAFSHWSVVNPFFRYATLGKVGIGQVTVTPAPPAGRPIRPHVWTVPAATAAADGARKTGGR